MGIKQIYDLFNARKWKARIITDRIDSRITIKMEPEKITEATLAINPNCPDFIKIEYLPLNWWDRFKMGKHSVRVELR